MSADLDQLFAALGTHADTVATAGPEHARARGRGRTRRQLTAVAVAVLLITAIVAVGVVRLGRPIPPARPEPAPTVRFQPLTPLGPVVPLPVGFGDGTGSMQVGDRVVVAVQGADGHIRLRAVSATTGRSVWSTVDLGRFDDAPIVIARPEGIVVLSQNFGTAPLGHRIMVLDPATGALRWQDRWDLELYWYENELVLADEQAHVMRGRDWITGADRWSIPYDGAADFEQPVASTAAVAPPDQPRFGGTATDHRLFRIDAAGTLDVIDADTGQVTSTRSGATRPNARNLTVLDDALYSVTPTGEIDRTDLSGGPLTTIYSSGDRNVILDSVAAAGPDRFTLLTVGATNQLVTVDRTGHTLWTAPVTGRGVQTAGDRVVTRSGEVFDVDGHQFASADPNDQATILTAGSLIRLHPIENARPVWVSGVSLVDGHVTALGQLPAIDGACTASRTLLICPVDHGIQSWRFAAD
jgi:hypothetical protein